MPMSSVHSCVERALYVVETLRFTENTFHMRVQQRFDGGGRVFPTPPSQNRTKYRPDFDFKEEVSRDGRGEAIHR